MSSSCCLLACLLLQAPRARSAAALFLRACSRDGCGRVGATTAVVAMANAARSMGNSALIVWGLCVAARRRALARAPPPVSPRALEKKKSLAHTRCSKRSLLRSRRPPARAHTLKTQNLETAAEGAAVTRPDVASAQSGRVGAGRLEEAQNIHYNVGACGRAQQPARHVHSRATMTADASRRRSRAGAGGRVRVGRVASYVWREWAALQRRQRRQAAAEPARPDAKRYAPPPNTTHIYTHTHTHTHT